MLFHELNQSSLNVKKREHQDQQIMMINSMLIKYWSIKLKEKG
jgi:hypothetical protein